MLRGERRGMGGLEGRDDAGAGGGGSEDRRRKRSGLRRSGLLAEVDRGAGPGLGGEPGRGGLELRRVDGRAAPHLGDLLHRGLEVRRAEQPLAERDLLGEERVHVLADLAGAGGLAGAGQPLFEGAREVEGGLVAPVAVALERLHHDRRELGGVVRAEALRPRHVVVEDRVDGARVGLAAEEPAADGDLPQHHAERPDVRAAVDRLLAQLLGAHVRDLALELAGDRAVLRLGLPAGDAEVDHLGGPGVGHEDVLRGDVSVHHAGVFTRRQAELVGGVQAPRGVGQDARDHHVGGRMLAAPAGAGHHAEGLAVEVLHRDEPRPVVFAEVEDGAEVRVVELRREPRLVQEHVHEAAARGDVGMDRLHGDPLLEPGGAAVLREVDRGHAALRDAIAQGVATQSSHTRARRRSPRVGRHQPGRLAPCARMGQSPVRSGYCRGGSQRSSSRAALSRSSARRAASLPSVAMNTFARPMAW